MEKPDLKVIFTSGYSAELIGPEFEQEKEHGFLSKPYLTERLAQAVAAQLESGASGSLKPPALGREPRLKQARAPAAH